MCKIDHSRRQFMKTASYAAMAGVTASPEAVAPACRRRSHTATMRVGVADGQGAGEVNGVRPRRIAHAGRPTGPHDALRLR